METKKKSIITLGLICGLCLVLCIGMFLLTPTTVAYAQDLPTAPTDITTSWTQEGETAWNNGTKVAFNTIAPNQYRTTATEDGTESKPYLIENVNDFGVFLYEISRTSETHAGKYFKIANNIDLGQYYLKRSAYSYYVTNFAGVLDGNSKTLSNVFISNGTYTETGIFNTLTGTVKNLTINNAVVSSTTISSVGVLAGKLLGNGSLDGVHVINSTVTATELGTDVGGIVGRSMHNAGQDVSIKNSSIRNSTINGNISVGGILGVYSPVTSAGETSNFNITNCLSYGNQINGAYKVGGIVGNFRGIYVNATQYAMATISRCYNYSTVTASNICAGGIVGGIAMGSSPMTECTDVQFTISECGNAGSITAGSFAGGISGIVFCEAAQTDNRVIEYCFNQGTITVGTIGTATLLGDSQYYYPVNATCYVSSAITFRTAATYTDGDLKICDIKSSYNTGDLILPENKSGLKTTGGYGGESDTTVVYSLAQSTNDYHQTYPLAGNSAYKSEYAMRNRVSGSVDILNSTYFEETSGYPILKNLDPSWYYKPTVTVGRVYGDTQTSGSVWIGTPVTNIPAESVDTTYNTNISTDDAYIKLYYAEKAGTTAQTADNTIKDNTTVYIKYQVPLMISGNENNVTVDKWQGEQLLLTDFNSDATLQKTDNTISGLVGQTLPLTVTAPASYTVLYTPISHSVTFINGASTLKTQSYNNNYALKQTDFPSVTANAGYTVKWFDAQNDGTEYTVGSAITESVTLYARQIANTSTPYSVKHYQESLTQSSGDGRIQQGDVWYKLKDTQNKTGTTDAQTAAVSNEYDGFTANSFSQATINGNGTTVINIYYERNSYTVTTISATGQTNNISKKYQSALTPIDISTNAGCGTNLGSKYFLNWYITGDTASVNAFADGNIVVENAISLSVNAETITVTNISVNSTTHKTTYYKGETLDVSNLTLAVTYNHATANTPTNIPVTSGMVSNFDTSTIGQNKSATISYQEKTTTLNYSVSEQTFALTFLSDGIQYGDEVNLTAGTPISANFPTVNPTKTGSPWDTRYEFLGWYTASNGGEKITTQTMPTDVYTVYAQFKTEHFILINDKDGAGLATNDWYESGSTVTPTLLIDSVKTVKPAWNYTDYSYVFYLNYNSETKSVVTETGFLITERTVVVYETVAKNYAISFVMNEHGAQINEILQGYGTDVSAPSSPTAVGYIFDGWFESSALTGSTYSFTTMPSGGTTLYAKWTECDHSLNTNEPTCTEGSTCSICGESLSALGHDLVLYPAVSATCTAAGNSAYWNCSLCGKNFSDENGTIEIEANSWTIDAIGHDWEAWISNGDGTHTHTCSNDEEHTETIACSSFADVVTAPTCTQQGYTTRTCKDCGNVTTINETAKLPHNLTAISALAPTHFEEGNIAYWQCSVCDKYFSDENGTTEITQAQTILSVIPHSYGSVWENDNSGHWHECTCGDKKDFVAHTLGEAATEINPQTCTVCGYIIEPATGHITHTPDTTQWYSNGINHWHKCVGCEEMLDITAHTGGTATCVDKADCEICDAEYGEFANHSYGEWTNANATQHQHTCSVCANIEYSDHIWNAGVITTEPTHSQAGIKTFTCTLCGETRTEGVPALTTHMFTGEVATADYLKTAATCTQKAVYYKSCICGEHGTETFEYGDFASHTLTPHSAVSATCTTAGNTAYWNCSVCGKYFSDENGTTEITADNRVAAALGHNYVFSRTIDPNFDTQTDGYDLYLCSHDENHFKKRNIVEWETLGVRIVVTNGTIGDSGETSKIVLTNGTVTVNAIEVEGKRFSGWQEENGNIVSTNAEYTFNASEAIRLTAVYEDIPAEPTGLSGGAIAGIAIACVLVTAIGGFAIFWFVIKKKS